MLKQCLIQLKWWILLYIAVGCSIQLFSSLGIVFFQKVLDTAVQANRMDEIIHFIIIYGLLLVGTVILNYVDEYPSVYLSKSISEQLKLMALDKISKIDYQAYQNIGTGQMIKVIENGTEAGNEIIYGFILKTLHELLPTILFSLLFISFYDPRIMLIIAIGYVVIFVVTNLLLKFLYRMKSIILNEQESMSRYSIRGFMELVVFRTNKRYEKEMAKLSASARQIINKSAQLRMIHEAFFAIFEVFITIIKLVILFFGVQSVIAGDSSIGVIVALFLFIEKIYSPIAIFNVLFVDYRLNQVTYKRFEAFIHAPEDRNLDSGLELAGLKGEIEFSNVSFSYAQHSILNNISLTIPQGTSVALVGMSGGGKSTLIKLLTGLVKKDSGKLLLDGVDIDELKLNTYYEHISYLSQETPIFDTTIRGNICFDAHVSNEAIYELLEKVHLKETILNLPEGLDTLVGERGVKLSGGERQRLAFARILFQRRNVLILDEPVSALDNITEKSIMETILQEFSDKTIIIVAHRLNFLQQVDQIVVMDNGRVAGHGSFDELIRNCKPFMELWQKKRLEYDLDP
ncbi:ABC transporter ATP-binding protein [Paenibacillus xylanilyticus]|uniref:ABC transporter ATP-binding protein n=1 Tax=Paenibacillus xylanilyticus TaxID=248903 RepID=A0A7Y6BXR2_9BACL|nr:ABC transporter ATP-binding protein [Paenibacillus xylanilyticus]NUU76889.1 ABC transporter ATP-binding protein [Paenibacillus xylanilyticus]